MSNSNNFESYFDDEEMQDVSQKTVSPTKDKETYKLPKSKGKKNNNQNEFEFNQPDPVSVSRKLVKDVKDLEEMDLEEMNSIPISAKYTEKFDSLEQLYQTYGNEDNEYEIVGLGDLKNYLGEDFNEMDHMVDDEDPLEQITSLETQFEEDPQNYEVLYKLIFLYRMTKNIEKLRNMREHTLKLFPFGEDMWKEWIDDELEQLTDQDFDRKYQFINLYFNRAFSDFYYFKISKKFLKFLINLKKELESKKLSIDKYPELDIENIRKKFEEFLEFWGLDFNLSSGIWDIYLNFENSNLEKFRKNKDEINYNHTLSIIRSIFRRRISFPHIDLDIVWKEYQKWETDEDELNKIEIKYIESGKRAEEMINLEEIFNDCLDQAKVDDDSTKLLEFLENEIGEKFKKYFNYIRLYYERALEINPDDEKIWESYINYNKTLNKNSEFTFKILSRASKCCFFHIKFWILLFREMERQSESYETIQAKIQEAYSSAEDPNFISEIWKYTLEFHCRFFDSSMEQLTHIRSIFDAAINDIQNKGNTDYIERILNIWSEFEVYKVKDFTKVIDIMNRIVKLNPTSDNWKLFISSVKYFGDSEQIRKIYKRALEYCREDKDYFSESWIVWEKIFGDVKSIEYALEYSKNRMKMAKRKPIRLSLRKNIEEENVNNHNKNQIEEDNKEEITTVKKKKLLKLSKNKEEIGKIDVSKEKIPMKNNISENISTFNKTVIIKNLSPMITEEELQNFIINQVPDLEIKDIRIVRDRKGISKGFSFVDFHTGEAANDCAIICNNKILDDNIISCAVSKPPKSGENDLRTIFVNNISYDSTEEKIKSAFESYGQIYDVRIIYDHVSKKPKGFCYVEFASEDSVNKVLDNRNNFYVDGRKVIVKSSQSVAKMREGVSNVALVTNIPFTLSEAKLKEFFIKNGIELIKDCLIATDNEGNSKGIAFVEFEDEESLKKALLLTGKMIRGRPVLIKMSTRNITRNKKTKASTDLEEEIEVNKKRKIEVENLEIKEEKKEKLDNKDFRKFLK